MSKPDLGWSRAVRRPATAMSHPRATRQAEIPFAVRRRRAAHRNAARPVHSAGRAAGVPRGLRGSARPAALPDRRQNLDILDIPLAKLPAQYMQYIEVMRDLQLELAASTC